MTYINSQTTITSPGNDGLKAVFYKNFSNELPPVLLDVGTINVTSRTRIISATYEKVMKEILKTIDPIHF